MLQFGPQQRIFVVVEPVDFRFGMDRLAAQCRQYLEHPMSGAVFVFRNRRATALRLLFYDGQGYWLCTKRLSSKRFQWWPRGQHQTSQILSARELHILLWNGLPEQAAMADDWRKVA